jgi:hypothetical protein
MQIGDRATVLAGWEPVSGITATIRADHGNQRFRTNSNRAKFLGKIYDRFRRVFITDKKINTPIFESGQIFANTSKICSDTE